MNMKHALLIAIFLAAAGFLQHVTHELCHIIAGKLVGLELVRVEWFSHHGGTKVVFGDEETVIRNSDVHVPKEWIIINLAGIAGTTLLAYLFAGIYLLLPLGYPKLLFWVLSGMFLIADAGYAVLCAFAESGDLYLVHKRFRNSRAIRLTAAQLLAVNLLVFLFLSL